MGRCSSKGKDQTKQNLKGIYFLYMFFSATKIDEDARKTKKIGQKHTILIEEQPTIPGICIDFVIINNSTKR